MHREGSTRYRKARPYACVGSARYRKGSVVCNASGRLITACPGRNTASKSIRYRLAGLQHRFGFMRYRLAGSQNRVRAMRHRVARSHHRFGVLCYRLARSQNRVRVHVLPLGPAAIPRRGHALPLGPVAIPRRGHALPLGPVSTPRNTLGQLPQLWLRTSTLSRKCRHFHTQRALSTIATAYSSSFSL